MKTFTVTVRHESGLIDTYTVKDYKHAFRIYEERILKYPNTQVILTHDIEYKDEQ